MRRLPGLVLLVVFLLGLVETARGDVYVNPTDGSDTDSCGTSAWPCQSLSKAVLRAQSGETVRLASGVYGGPQNVPLRINTAQRLSFLGSESTDTTIDCSSVDNGDCVSVTISRFGENSFGSLTLQNIAFSNFFPKDNKKSVIDIVSALQSECSSAPQDNGNGNGVDENSPAEITINHCSFNNNQYQTQMGSPSRLGRIIEVDGSLVADLSVDVAFCEFVDNKIPVSSITSAIASFRFCLFRNIRNSLTNNVTPLILETTSPTGSPQFAQLYRSQISFEDCLFDQNIDGSSGSSPLLFFDSKNFFTSFLRCTFSSNQASSLIDFEGLVLQISDSAAQNNQLGRVAIHSGIPSSRPMAPIIQLQNSLFEADSSNHTIRILSGSFSEGSNISSLTVNCPTVDHLAGQSLINFESGSLSIIDSVFNNCSNVASSFPSTSLRIDNCVFQANPTSDDSEVALITATGSSIVESTRIASIAIHQSSFSSLEGGDSFKYIATVGAVSVVISNSTFDDGKKIVKCSKISPDDEDDETFVQFVGQKTIIPKNRLLVTSDTGNNCDFVCAPSNGEMCNTLRSSWVFPILFALTLLFATGVTGAYLKLAYSSS